MSITRIWKPLCLLGLLALMLSGCNTSNVSEGLTPTSSASTGDPVTANNQPQPSQTVGSADDTSATALASASVSTPAASAATSQANPQPLQTAALTGSDSFTFLPITGAPQTAVTTLSRNLSQTANQSGLVLVPANQSGAKYQVKGYFSALNDGSGTLLVYVWDVLDNSGNRLHRINGQERSTTSASNPWQGITDTELQRVASATVSRLNVWAQNN